jgi:adenylate cyclase
VTQSSGEDEDVGLKGWLFGPKGKEKKAEGERRLAAIMFTDIVGYTSLTQKDESSTLQALKRHRSLLRPLFSSHGGREIKTMGDAFLVEFQSALDAVLCAIAVQQMMHDRKVARGEQLSLRIGVHVGDVVESGNDILGDAVNIASRIEPLAEPGGICISDEVYRQVRNKSDLPFVSLGEKSLKNVSEPIEVYKMMMPWIQKETTSNPQLDKTRVAVLPFTNMSSDPEEGYFADGMTEELITSLSAIRQLTVIARTSVMGYKGTAKKAKEIGTELGAGSMLEGSVRKAGNRVRITAQLIDTGTEGHLWAQNYDRQYDDVFAIQSEIAEKVAGELEIRLVGSEKHILEKKPTENTEAYTYFLRGRELLREETESSLKQAVVLFEKALGLDPAFARARASLVECFLWLANNGYEPYEQAMPKAEMSAKKALDLDPELAEAHVALANVCFVEDRVRSCEVEAKRAIELNRSLPEAHRMLANVAMVEGDLQKGIDQWEAAYGLDPLRPRYIERLGQCYFYAGREDEALQFWEKTVPLAPAGTYRNMTEYYLLKEDYSKAKEFYSKAEKLEPTDFWVSWMGGFIPARMGDEEEALRAIRKIEENWVSAISLNSVAFIHYGLGDLDSYFTYMRRAVDQHLVDYVYLMHCPLFAKGRNDLRYEALIDRMKRQINESA